MTSAVQDRGNGPAQDDEVTQRQGQGEEACQTTNDPSKGLDRTLDLLAAKDDTSRFVGLALLKSILDHRAELREDPEIVKKFWDTIPPKFLDRLLKAGANDRKPKEEAQSMIVLAVAVLHAFIVLLPDYVKRSEKSVERIPGLLDALARSTEEGSVKLLQSQAWLQLVAIAPQQNLVLDIVKYAFIGASEKRLEHHTIQKAFDSTISTLVVSFQDAPLPTGFFDALFDIITGVPDEFRSMSPAWLSSLADLIIQSCLCHHNAASPQNRHGLVVFTATTLRLYPLEFPSLLFSGAASSPQSTPKSILFVKLMLVDIKSSIPSFQEILNSSHYPATATRIASTYDIISAFIGFLVNVLDQEESPCGDSKLSLPFSPSSLLQLRADISETISLTIEHLRDRFDASVAGASGLHPSARSRTEASPTAPLAITWDSSFSPMPQDHLTLGQIQTLALWLHEDDNDNLRKEAAGIMDVMLSLFSSEDGTLDFRSPVLMCLESIIIVPEGINAFLAGDGWSLLAKDLRNIVLGSSLDASQRGIDIVRVLLKIVESDITGPTKEDWMDLVKLAARPDYPNPSRGAGTLELRIAVAQLAVELLVRAPTGVRRKYLAAAHGLSRIIQAMRNDDSIAGEAREGLEEIVSGLDELGFTSQGS